MGPKVWEGMSEAERAAFSEQAQALVDCVTSEAAEGKINCRACGRPIPLEQNGNQWSAICSCGWGAVGQGYAKPRFN